jgi:peptidoglycan hydrolase-like protein with peptidoglycan-binding domain
MAKRKKKSAMTASILSQLPVMAGSVLLTNLGRGAQWAFSRYMRAPAASTAILALVTMSAMAGSNALYFQQGRHPSPFFAQDSAVPYSVQTSTAPAVAPVPAPLSMREEAVDMASAPAQAAPQTTGSVATQPQAIPDQPVGNAEVFAVQKKLAELKLFEGTVDGYYGPRTARAIRAFEERNGFAPMGALSSGIVQAILGSDGQGRAANAASAPQPVVTPAPAPQPQAVVAPVVTQPVQLATSAPAPAPVVQQQDQVVARLPSLGPVEAAVDTVGTAAANTIDSIVAAVDGGRASRAVSNSSTQIANIPTPSANVPSQAMPAPVAVVQPVAAVQTKPSAPQRAARPATDKALVSDIQRGLASLGFFRGTIDGNPGPETARAIREFENFHRYKVTGQVQPDLIDLLRNAGAAI